jgi:hypothetical protein
MTNCIVQSDRDPQTHAVIITREDDPGLVHLSQRLDQMYRTDFIERLDVAQHPSSQEDYQFLKRLDEETVLLEGRYQLPLPIRDEANIKLPDNRLQALNHALRVRSKLQKPGACALKDRYVESISKLLQNGHAQLVPNERKSKTKDGTIWYMLYHVVEHPQNGKFRLVFNCAKEYDGVSLNDVLIPGPAVELTNSLVGVLLRWRKEPYAVMGDNVQMFSQTRVPEPQRTFLRFLWW